MKRSMIFAICVMAVALAATVTVVSCKKDDQNAKLNNNGNAGQPVSQFDASHITDMDDYLKSFRKKMATSQFAKDAETLGLDEAAWHLSSVANYEFANANVEFTDLRHDTLLYQVNVTDGQVALADLNALYETMATDIDAFYHSLDLQDKHFRFIGVSVSDDGQVKASLISSYVMPDHTWYFQDGWDALVNCLDWFDFNTNYVWNTTACSLLEQACNFYEGRSFSYPQHPPVRSYYVFSREVTLEHQNYTDPYGSPHIDDSRIYAWEAEIWATPTLDFDMMCYCLDSYLDLPFQYANQHSNMFNERPVNWKVIPNKYKLGENKWYTFCHILQVKFGRYITTQHPIAY